MTGYAPASLNKFSAAQSITPGKFRHGLALSVKQVFGHEGCLVNLCLRVEELRHPTTRVHLQGVEQVAGKGLARAILATYFRQ